MVLVLMVVVVLLLVWVCMKKFSFGSRLVGLLMVVLFVLVVMFCVLIVVE